SQSLRYNLTVVTQDRSVQSRCLAEEQLDGQPFLHYDREEGRAESQGWRCVLLDGSGTYQTWSIRAPQGEEQMFKCYGEQFGSHCAHPVPSGEPGVTLQGVLTLVWSGPRDGEGEQACGSEVPRL
ncbi:MHC class I polypeptide-related sequence A-like, partial [Pteropus medius]|uniref:MHC class I polypeptide-related sequence A-like n=1 Tax=Pteropus vampyrus TaxID=132908 RepID=UPI00196A9B98